MTDYSPPYTIHMGPGVQDVLTASRALLQDELAALESGTGYTGVEELADKQRELLARYASLVGCLTRILATTAHDGPDIDITRETVNRSLYFRYRRSGYHGGMIYHGDQGWSVHT